MWSVIPDRILISPWLEEVDARIVHFAAGNPARASKDLAGGCRQDFQRPRPFHKDYKKLTGDDPTPLMPEEMDKAIKELPRDPEVVELFKKISGGGPLPPR